MNENKKREKEFHENRRMFMIVGKELFIAPKNSILSHQEWAKLEKISEDKNGFDEIVRGFVDSEGIYFYKGKNFTVDEKAKEIFFSKLNEIIERMKIDSGLHIFSEMVKQEKLGKWPAKKDYGAVKDFIKKL